MMQIQQDWSEIRKAPIDTFEIEMKAREFYLCLDYENENVLEKMFEAKHILSSARILVMNIIDPQDNKYIKDSEEAYKWLIDNTGRIDKFFDEAEEKTLTSRELTISIKPEDYPKESFIITNYIRRLDVMMQHLVYYPLKNSCIRFNKPFYKDGKKVEKINDLFGYFVFVELFKSSQSLGNIMYEKKKKESSFYEPPSSSQIPDELPKTVKVKEEKPEEPESKDFDLTDSFKETGFQIKDLEDEDETFSEEEDKEN